MTIECVSPRAGGNHRAWLPSARSAAGAGDVATAAAGPHGPGPAYRASLPAAFVFLAPLLLLAACAHEVPSAVKPEAPGFLLGLWHGFIFPVAWVLSLFMPDVAIYAVPNNGGWYDFGYFLGIMVLGVGARKSHIVYRDRFIRVRRDG